MYMQYKILLANVQNWCQITDKNGFLKKKFTFNKLNLENYEPVWTPITTCTYWVHPLLIRKFLALHHLPFLRTHMYVRTIGRE